MSFAFSSRISCPIVISFLGPSIEHRDCFLSPLLPHLFSFTPPIPPILYPFAASFLPYTHSLSLHPVRHWLFHHQRSGPPTMPCLAKRTRLGVHTRESSSLETRRLAFAVSQTVSSGSPFNLFLVCPERRFIGAHEWGVVVRCTYQLYIYFIFYPIPTYPDLSSLSEIRQHTARSVPLSL